MTECRRCGDCQGQDHHWAEELVFGEDDDDFDVVGDRACKHCPVVGLTCDECDGEGCWACGDEGVKLVPGVTVDDGEIES